MTLFARFLTLLVVSNVGALCFVFPPTKFRTGASRSSHVRPARRRRLFMSSSFDDGHRTNIEIPLLDLRDSEYADKIITPLPSAHLPTELRTIYLYGMELRRPVHKMLIQEAIEKGAEAADGRLYGHLVTTRTTRDNNTDDLIGAIGCTAEILINAQQANPTNAGSDVGDDAPITVLCRGAYRFQVREIIKTFPFPVAIVDELVDDEAPSSATTGAVESSIASDEEGNEEDDDEEEELDPYVTLDTSDLVRRIMVGLKALVDHKLSRDVSSMSPLEQSILEDSGISIPVADVAAQAEEMAAVLEVFQSSLIDIAPMPVDRYFAIGMLAGEMADFDNAMRERLLCMTDGVARLRVVLKEVERKVALTQARKVADEVTEKSDEASKDLKVGEPQLPPWVKQLKDGTRVEYYWNEEWGWCGGVIVGDPVKIVDELIVTVRFDDDEDGETHRLPFRADEKVRWRPPQQ